jgi:hypothetical protein
LSRFDWIALACGIVAVVGIAAMRGGRWRPKGITFYALVAAAGIAIGAAIGRLAAASFVAFLGLAGGYVALRWDLRRRRRGWRRSGDIPERWPR